MYIYLMTQTISAEYLERVDRASHAQRHIDPSRTVNADRRISARVTAAQYEQLEIRAKALRITMTELVRLMCDISTERAISH